MEAEGPRVAAHERDGTAVVVGARVALHDEEDGHSVDHEWDHRRVAGLQVADALDAAAQEGTGL
jgi:hypothetical protein